MRQLGWPTILCHKLDVNAEGRIVNYTLRQPNQKQHVGERALRGLNYKVIAAGDSATTTRTMLDRGQTRVSSSTRQSRSSRSSRSSRLQCLWRSARRHQSGVVIRSGIAHHRAMSDKRFSVAQLDDIKPVPCPCGQARRAFNEPGNNLATVHLTEISADSRAHYHKVMTEIYIVLEGEGYLEADGERIPLKPMTSVMIKPVVSTEPLAISRSSMSPCRRLIRRMSLKCNLPRSKP